jgi:hypothetical protein
VIAHAGEPLERVHGLEVSAERGVHAGAVEHRLLPVEVDELPDGEVLLPGPVLLPSCEIPAPTSGVARAHTPLCNSQSKKKAITISGTGRPNRDPTR